MKKHSRLIALLLTALMLVSVAACSGTGTAESTEAPGTSTSDPAQTTVPVTEEASTDITGDSTGDEPPSSSGADEETTAPEQTAPPEAEDVLLILKQKEQNVTSLFDDEENRSLSDARAERFLREHSSAAVMREVADIVSAVKNATGASDTLCDLLMLEPTAGVKLLIGANLENLAEAGISINSDTVGVRKELTESLTYGGTYLVACDALSSYLSASYALKYDGTALSIDPVAAALDGSFTVELMLTYIAEQKADCLAVGEISSLTVYRGVGGNIFVKDERGLPAAALTLQAEFSSLYTYACELYSKAVKKDTGIFTLAKVGDDTDAVWLPIPKAEATADYSTPLDTNDVVLFAAPVGVVDGARLHALFTAYNLVSSDYIEAARAKLTHADRPYSAELARLIESTATIDLGPILGWGDLDDVIANGINTGTKASALLSDRVVQMQIEAVEAAAAIVAGRLEIE
ncbi:MAG: hypothetical protein ACI3XI_01835 [Eubacteriales bacterium]